MPRRKVERCKRGHFMTPGARYKDGSCRECQVARARERREAGTAVQRSVHKKRMAEVAREVRERMDAEREARQQRLADRLANDAAVQLCREERARRKALPSNLLSPALIITLPMPLNIGNGSHGHWRTRLSQKQAYFKALDTLQAAGKIPAPPKEPLDRATVDSVMHLARQMDVDNAMRRHKWPLDWLRTRRYIVDDSPAHLSWMSFPEQRVKRNGDYKIVLTFSQKAA